MSTTTLKKFTPGHYLQDKSRTSSAPDDLKPALSPGFTGAVVEAPWAKLEPTRGVYDFSLIRDYLAWGKANDRQLVFIIHDRDFKTPAAKSRTVPRWLNAAGLVVPSNGTGCVAKLWLPQVTDYRIALIAAIVTEFDNHRNLEAIALQETALGGVDRKTQPDYDNEKYCNEIVRLIRTVAPALKRTQLWQSMNWLGPMNGPYLDRIAQAMKDAGAGGITNPDSVPWEINDKPMYAVMKASSPDIAVAFGGDTSQLDKPGGEHYASFAQLVQMQYDFAKAHGAHYMFWNSGFTSQASATGLGKDYLMAVKALVANQPLIVDVPLTLRGVDDTVDPDPVDPILDTALVERVAMLDASFTTLRNDLAIVYNSHEQLANAYQALALKVDGAVGVRGEWDAWRERVRQAVN